MPPRIKNAIVDIPLNGRTAKGILNGNETSWSFESLSRDFLAMFPTGIVSNFTYLDAGTKHYEHRKFQMKVESFVREFLNEQGGKRTVSPGTSRNTSTARRFVLP